MTAGTPVATLLDPLAESGDAGRTVIRAPIDGVVYARALCRLARAGSIVAKIAGAAPLPDRKGSLLSD